MGGDYFAGQQLSPRCDNNLMGGISISAHFGVHKSGNHTPCDVNEVTPSNDRNILIHLFICMREQNNDLIELIPAKGLAGDHSFEGSLSSGATGKSHWNINNRKSLNSKNENFHEFGYGKIHHLETKSPREQPEWKSMEKAEEMNQS